MKTKPGTLVLLRHGQSVANAADIFTGVLDVELTPQGVQESLHAAELIRATGVAVDEILTSPLLRSRATASLAAGVFGLDATAIRADWRLIERSYGALTGQPKADVLRRYGREQFVRWRRTVTGTPPAMPEELHRRLALQDSLRGLPAAALPYTESLREVIARAGRFLADVATPLLRAGRCTLIVAHGNSLRALCTCLDDLTDEEVAALNIPTGQPLVYEFTPQLEPVRRGGRYLDEESARAAAAEVAAQGGT